MSGNTSGKIRQPRLHPNQTTGAAFISPTTTSELSRRITVRKSRLLASSPRIAELADTFPGLVHALASKRGSLSERRKALAEIRNGVPLKTVAETLRMPMWMRRLPAKAFGHLPPELPQSKRFNRNIANRIPSSHGLSPFWLEAILFAERAAEEDFAFWLAAQPHKCFDRPHGTHDAFVILAAYAWYSRHPEFEASQLIRTKWHPLMSFNTAMCASMSWLNRITLALAVHGPALQDCWLQPRKVRGFDIVPLQSCDEILAEARKMNNCIDQYARRLTGNLCRLFSIRRNNKSVATIEIGFHRMEDNVLTITQLKGRRNVPVGTEIWQAAYAWLAEQPNLMKDNSLPRVFRSVRPDQSVWGNLWTPYRKAKDGAVWVPSRVTHGTLRGLNNSLVKLADNCDIHSWLFMHYMF